ncbi:halocyanin domain-containing protein [Haloarchaeobius salinus]|uniref:halocyanin domain-containing protein n=1 Tax=Haloarchaeobius salinus TaxID=1198298 RepID=UPI002108A6E8|nr:halocyanin domain-containing protein [Haloarchaeobius salinus]
MQRRRVLAGLAAVTGSLAGCLGGGRAGGTGGPNDSYGDWFDGVDNYDGEVDRTGESETTVLVGADDGLAFEPAAVRLSPGTTVVWEWTGDGGAHNVQAEAGGFESDLVDDEGHTFEHTFSEPSLVRYVCDPHRDLGMRGGVRVVEE